MEFHLTFDDDVPTSVRRNAREQIEGAIEQLEANRASDPVKAVHEARKNLKRSRSLLRLVRTDLGKRAYRDENVALGEAGRSISHVRDADVMVATVEALADRFAGQVPSATFEALRAPLAEAATASRDRADAKIADELIAKLKDAAARVDQWPLDDVTWRTVRRGIGTAYERGRKAFAAARRHPTDENLHEWRKRVKDLQYQQRLLADAWPAVLTAQAKEAHALSDLLGDDHDLAVLTGLLDRTHPERRDALIAPEEIHELIDRRRSEIQTQATELGERIYAEKPKAFDRRIGRYLRAARGSALAAA